jgi:hypothetical protein
MANKLTQKTILTPRYRERRILSFRPAGSKRYIGGKRFEDRSQGADYLKLYTQIQILFGRSTVATDLKNHTHKQPDVKRQKYVCKVLLFA